LVVPEARQKVERGAGPRRRDTATALAVRRAGGTPSGTARRSARRLRRAGPCWA